ncbi:MAG TPA: hypothetical protein VJO14_03260 [Bacteroidota bacterium]|nr:hypothetical protein [Bacteroidota bacterium]
MDLQQILALAAVGAAAVRLIRHYALKEKKAKSPACANCEYGAQETPRTVMDSGMKTNAPDHTHRHP